ncbi:Uma2 family endonuclease [Paludisphaera sp.]|uniref:Uma2 family endonuclease n=1 Tax=Paludisphaera sp. TaxID=2017432 RepID=UPI00301E4E60
MPTTTIDREPVPTAASPEPPDATLVLPPDVRLYVEPDDFERLCAANRDLRLEREADGALIAMTPASTVSGGRELTLAAQVWNWANATGLGRAFGPSAGFTLPDTAVRAPDVSWIRHERLDALPPGEGDRFARIVPDFVAELRSPSDRIEKLRAKMAAYIAHGVRLGWLIDPKAGTVEIYRPGREAETLTGPKELSGEDVLPGFTLDLTDIVN